jgi:hypothetical protein
MSGIHGDTCEECGLLGCNAVFFRETNVSEKHIASVFRVKE